MITNELPTPRTEAALNKLADDQRGAVYYNGVTFIEFARQLERELDAEHAARKAAERRFAGAYETSCDLGTRLDALNAALTDVLSVFEHERNSITEERLEAWKETMKKYGGFAAGVSDRQNK